MVADKLGHDDKQDNNHYDGYYQESEVYNSSVVFIVLLEYNIVEPFDERVDRNSKTEEKSDPGIRQEQQEVLPIKEPDAVMKPRAVVVHIKNAPPTCRAVVAPLGLVSVAVGAVIS